MSLVPFSALQHYTGYEQPAAVRRWLDERGVRYLDNRRGEPVTTTEAINAAMLTAPLSP